VAIIYGADSALITPARAAAMAALLPAGHGPYALAGAHHHLMLDQPLALAALLLELLARPLSP
jgi:pimeloyl-ACP methyl ester carboxylesterase